MPPQDRLRLRYRLLRSGLLIIVPLLALAAWLAIQQSDRMVAPTYYLQRPSLDRGSDGKLQLKLRKTNQHFFLPSLVYDEYDMTAMAQRGLNAELGRQPGAPASAPIVRYDHFSQSVEAPRPLKPRYFLEYPHAALLLFRAGYWIQPGWRDLPMPPGLPDCAYHNIAVHDPETDDQFAFWRVFVVATRFYAVVMVVAFLLLILVLECGYGPATELSGGSLLLLLPAAIFFTLNRFDILPALLTALCFACLGRRCVLLAGAFLAVAALVKVYPALFAPLVLRYLWSDRRQALQFALAFGATGLLAFTPMLTGADWEALIAPYRFQLTRRPEHGLTIYGCLLPESLANGLLGGLFRAGSMLAVLVLMMAAPIRDLTSLLRRCGVVLMVFVSLAVFYSPQWVLWFAPLLLPLVRRNRRVGWVAASLDLINYVTFPFWFWVLPEMIKAAMNPDWVGFVNNQIGNLLRLLRFACSGFLVWALVRHEWPWQAWFHALRRRVPIWDTIFARRN